MRRRLPLFSLFATTALASLSEGFALAQKHHNNPAHSFGVGVGMYSGPRGVGGPYYGPMYGVYPLYYPGFYGNGMSMYGPPVATYGPIPGTFGGSDYRTTQSAPFFGTSLGWFGSRSPSPRPAANFQYNPPVAANPGEPPMIEPIVQDKDAKPLTMEVRLPIENAIVFVNNSLTRQSGPVRTFASPPLPGDQAVEYDIRAEWVIEGKKVSLTKTVSGKPGETVVADFVK